MDCASRDGGEFIIRSSIRTCGMFYCVSEVVKRTLKAPVRMGLFKQNCFKISTMNQIRRNCITLVQASFNRDGGF